MSPVEPYPVPVDESALRLDWPFLPPTLRSWIEHQCGSPVTKAITRDSGFTPGFASVLVCRDGSRHFVKAASTKAQRLIADSYREEARKLRALPPQVPAPRLRWSLDDDWVVLGIDYVAGSMPSRPWKRQDLDATLDALEVVAELLTPPPPTLELDDAATDLAGFAAGWDAVRRTRRDLPHLDEAAALARRHAEACGGDTMVHADIRADNVLIRADGTAVFCDWNWPFRGPAWYDSLTALIGPRGDGLDVQRVIGERPLLRDVDPEHVDIVLATLVGYFYGQGDQQTPHNSPWIRAHQRWQGDVCWGWLRERRGWQ